MDILDRNAAEIPLAQQIFKSVSTIQALVKASSHVLLPPAGPHSDAIRAR